MADAVLPVYIYGAVVEAVHDGDTFHAAIHLGFFVDIHPAVRILGINAPELSALPAGPAALAHLLELIPVGTRLILKSEKPDKYGGRVDAAVIRASDGLDVGRQMILDGFAVAYSV